MSGVFVGRTLYASAGLPFTPLGFPNPGDPPVPMVFNSQSGDFESATLEIIAIDVARIVFTLRDEVSPEEVVYNAAPRGTTNYVFPGFGTFIGETSSSTIEIWLTTFPIVGPIPVPPPPPPSGVDSNLLNVDLIGLVKPEI